MHKSKRVHFSKLPNVRAFCLSGFLAGNMLCGFENPLLPTAPFRAVFALSVTPTA